MAPKQNLLLFSIKLHVISIQMILKLQITFVFRLAKLVENISPYHPKDVTNNWQNLCAREITVSVF